MLKKFVAILLSLLCVGGIFTFGGCSLAEGPRKGYGDFLYCYIGRAGDTRPRISGDYIAVLELTEEGRQKETLIIPDEIEGKPVIQIGMTGLGYDYSIRHGSYKNLYLPKNLAETVHFDQPGNMGSKLFFPELNDLSFLSTQFRHFYVTNELYNRFIAEYDLEDANCILHIANMEFVSEDKTYFIADYDEGDLIDYIPTNPVREGYTFGGWYKESECENAWDFEEDTFSLTEGQTIMKLYAKWLS